MFFQTLQQNLSKGMKNANAMYGVGNFDYNAFFILQRRSALTEWRKDKRMWLSNRQILSIL
ncbi:hypothetical protein CON72_29265 [Bacillus wiedmannii]|nr:hypothetical protein CON72_29265 [Bacillus wiedmannii]